MHKPSGHSSSGGYKFNVIDSGDMWRVLNRPDIADFVEMTYPGFNAAFGIDPTTGSHVVVYLDYYKAAYDKEELEDPTSPIGKSIKAKLEKCLICSTMDQMPDELSISSQDKRSLPSPSVPAVLTPTPAQLSPVPPSQMSSGEFIMPRYIPALTSIGQKVLCTKFGGVASSVIFSVVADLLSGWSSDPGQKAAFRQISDQYVDQMGLCNEHDVEILKSDIGRLYDSWQKDGDIFKAVKRGMFKDVADALKDQGIQVNATKNTSYSLSARPLRRSSAD